MRLRNLLPALVLGAGLVGLAVMQAGADDSPAAKKPAAGTADEKKIAKLIEQLGSDSSAERQKAGEALDEIGAAALAALRKASKSSDAEVHKRATELVARIEKRTTAGRVLAPTEVHLVFKDTPVAKAVEEIGKKSGYTIKLHDPDGKMKDVTVTLDTGKTTFWNALDQFCAKAGLVDGNPNQALMVMPGRPGLVPPAAVPVAPPAPPAPPAVKPPAKVEKKDEAKAPEKKKDGEKKEEAKKPAAPRPVIGRILPGGPRGPVPFTPFVNVQPGEIYLVPGKLDQKAADTTTAVRVRPADLKQSAVLPADKANLSLVLQVSAEPKVRLRRIVAVKIDRATDDNDQKLSAVETPAPGNPGVPGLAPGAGWMPTSIWGLNALQQYTTVKLKKGDKESKSLKELSGTIATQLLDRAEPLLVVDDVMKAAGKTVKGKKDGYLKVTKVEKAANGNILIDFEMEMPAGVSPETDVNIPIPEDAFPGLRRPAIAPPAPPAKGAAVPPKGIAPPLGGVGMAAVGMQMPALRYAMNGLTLRDDKGKPIYVQLRSKSAGAGFVPGAAPGSVKGKMEYTATYLPLKGVPAEPTKLVFTGRRMVDVDVPFTLKDVKLK